MSHATKTRLTALGVLTFLVAYGSLYPFDFRTPADLASAFAAFLADRRLWTSRGDVLGNVGLFVPFGLAGVWPLSGRPSSTRTVTATLAGGLVLALALQIAQIWSASRSPVLSDVVWNGVGLALGAAAGLLLSSKEIVRLVGLQRTPPGIVVLLSLWVVAELAPLVPSLDLQAVRRSARLILLTPSVELRTAAHTAVQVLLVGRLLYELAGPQRVGRVLLATLGLVLVGKVVVVGLRLDWTAITGCAVGAAVWYMWSAGGTRTMSAHALAGVLLTAYTLRALEPFALRQPVSFSWIPFAGSLRGDMLANLRSLTAAAFVLGGVLWLVREVRWRALPATVTLVACVLALEIAQMWIVGRAPDSTEPLLALAIGWALWRMEPGGVTDEPGSR